jgi:GH18 family chitinase
MYKLKRRKSSLKMLIAVGGWTAASEAFNKIIVNATTRAIFIRQTKEFLYEWNFDGIDLVGCSMIHSVSNVSYSI